MNCPACSRPIPPKHAHFCPECWMKVPAKIRVEIYQMTARKQDVKTKVEQGVRAMRKPH